MRWRLVSLRNLMGLSSPLLGSIADRIGYRAVMRIGLLLTGIGFLLLATGAGLPVIIIGMIVTGIGQAGYTPMAQSYLSAKLPYSKRSRYLGILEYSWALAGIIGLFLIGHLIEWSSWRAPLFILAAGFFFMTFVFTTLPKAKEERGEPEDVAGTLKGADSAPVSELETEGVEGGPETLPASTTERLRRFLYLGPHKRSAWAAISINFFNFFAISHVMIIHGGWLVKEYGLRAGELGNVALLLGMIDWAASILVSIYGDRIGKKRSVLLGLGGMIVFFGLMPLLNVSLPFAVIAIALPRFCFEFATVSNFPLISEQYPAERGKVMSLSFAMGLSGPVIAGMTGPVAYLEWGVWGLGPVSLLSSLCSLLLLLLFVAEEPHGSPSE